ncbi:MAG: antitoxin component YwqK of YwqJK toxin-antitoxin module [Crocinitomix sp.]|jgi:antitoxin component YwqK of YwqJK toxin-antitoxin module
MTKAPLLILLLISISITGYSQNFEFYFNVGDCDASTGPNHLIADSSEVVHLDWDNSTSGPDSARISILDTTFILKDTWKFSTPKLAPGIIHFTADIYSGQESVRVDTNYNVTALPNVYCVVHKLVVAPSKFKFAIRTYDQRTYVEVSDQFFVCFAAYDILDSLNAIKVSGGGQQEFQLDYLQNDSTISLVEGDRVHLLWVRLFSKEINRDVPVYSNTKVALFESDSVFKEYYENGQLFFKVPINNGLQNGWYVQYHKTGQEFFRNYRVNGEIQDGTYYELYSNGNVYRECHYKNGVEHGTWTCYTPDGSQFKQYIFNKGSWVSEKKWNKEKEKWVRR